MLHRAAVSDKALGLLMDRCRATFAKPEPGGGFTLYVEPNRNQMKYRVTAEMHRAAQKRVKTGVQHLRDEMKPIRMDSRIRAQTSSH
jgi:coproporphyrinogen III oxidase-like Fe-S oxidoreductase